MEGNWRAGKIRGYIPKTEPTRSILTVREKNQKEIRVENYVAIFFAFGCSHSLARNRPV